MSALPPVKNRPNPPPRRAAFSPEVQDTLARDQPLSDVEVDVDVDVDKKVTPGRGGMATRGRPISGGLNKGFITALNQTLVDAAEKRPPALRQHSEEPSSLKPVNPTLITPTAATPTTGTAASTAKAPKRSTHRRAVSVASDCIQIEHGRKEIVQPPSKAPNTLTVTALPLPKSASIISTSDLSKVSKEKHRKSTSVGKKFLGKLTGARSLSDEIQENQGQSAGSGARDVAIVKEEFAYFLLNQSLRFLGLSASDQAEIESQIKQNYAPLTENRFTPMDSDIIKETRNRLEELNDTNSKHLSATKIQCLFRTWRVRRTIRPYFGHPREIYRIIQYGQAFRLFLEQEQLYCKRLQALIGGYLQPARQRFTSGAKEVLKMEDISHIFSNCEIILELHEDILRKLEAVAQNDWPLVQGVGRIIVEASKGLPAYGVYAGNFVNSQENVKRLRADKSGKFNLWLQEIESKQGDFKGLLAEPLSHIENMESALGSMLNFMAKGQEDRDLIAAYSLIHETQKFVKEHQKRSEITAVLMLMQRRILHDKPIDLVKDDRRFLLESQFLVAGSKRVFILCSDILMVGKPIKGTQFRLKEMRSLEVVQFEAIPSVDNSFIIKTPTAVYKVTGKAEECSQWLAQLSEYEESNKWNRTIGVSLDLILKREASSIPSIVVQCVQHIQSIPGGLETEGLFRISGEHNQIAALKKIFDQLPPSDRDLTPYSIHAVAGVLKLFLRELPEPLLSFSAYEKLLQVDRS